MRFKSWLENNMFDPHATTSPNRGSDSVASNDVKRTGLQPQVDSGEIQTQEKDDQKKKDDVAKALKKFQSIVAQSNDVPSLNKLSKKLDKLVANWQNQEAEPEMAPMPQPEIRTAKNVVQLPDSNTVPSVQGW